MILSQSNQMQAQKTVCQVYINVNAETIPISLEIADKNRPKRENRARAVESNLDSFDCSAYQQIPNTCLQSTM